MKVQFTNTFDGTECFSVASNIPTSSVAQSQRNYFAAGFSDGCLRIWDFNELTGAEGTTLDRPKFLIEDAFTLGPVDVKLDQSGQSVAASSIDNSIKVFGLQEGDGANAPRTSVLCEASGDDAQAWKIDFDVSGSSILTGQLSLHTMSLEQGGGKMKRDAGDLAENQKFIHSIACARNGALAASGNIDGIVQLYDLKARKYVARFSNHNLAVRSLAFDNSSNAMISAGEDLHIFVSDVESQQRLQTLVGHGEWVTSICPHPVNRDIFLSSSLDHTVKIWSTHTHKKISEIDLGSPVWGAAYSPSGDYFAVATENGTISVLNTKQLATGSSSVI